MARRTEWEIQEKWPLERWVVFLQERDKKWGQTTPRDPHDLAEDARRHMQSAKSRARSNRRLRRDWPKGVKKSQVVLEHIKAHPKGLTKREIQQFVFNKNGHRGKSPGYYWDEMLLYNPRGDGRLRLLPSWCTRGEDGRWRLKRGMKIAPPFFRLDREHNITAGEFRQVMGYDPRVLGIRKHSWKPECSCPMDDDYVIFGNQLPPEIRIRLRLKER